MSEIVKVEVVYKTVLRFAEMKVYNKDHTMKGSGPVSHEFAEEILGPTGKPRFFYAHREDGEIVFDGPAPDQDW